MTVVVSPVSSAIRPIQSSSVATVVGSSPGLILAIAISNTLPPPARTAPAIANSSSSAANVPGTGVPSRLVCPSVRDVVNPNAPASIAAAAAHLGDVVGGRLLVAAPRSPIT